MAIGRVGDRVFWLVVWTAVAANVLKGLPHQINDMGFPYWTMTYDEGFIRRGLVGTVVHELLAGFDPDSQRKKVLALDVALAFAFCALLCIWARRASDRLETPRARALVFGGTAALLLSQFPTTTVASAGYLDIVLFYLCIGTAYLADQRRYRVGGLVAAIGPIVHEAFLFLWLPIALIAVRRVVRLAAGERRAAIRQMLPLFSPLATAVLTFLLHSTTGAERMIQKAPVVPSVQESFRLYQYGLGVEEALVIMLRKFADVPGQFFLACAFFLPAIVMTAACAYALDRTEVRWRRSLFVFAATLAPCSVLLVAWDLSRFLLWAGIGAFVLLVSNATDAPRDVRPSVRAAPFALALAMLVLLSTGPYVYAYFEVAFADYPASPALTRKSPAAKLTYAFLRVYNRMQFVREWATDAEGKCNADAPEVERIEPCSFVVRKGQWAESKELWLGPGDYEATIRTAPADTQCGGSPASVPVAWIAPHVIWRFGDFMTPTRVEVTEPTTTTIRFAITEEESALGRAKVRVTAIGGCFRVDQIRVVRKEAR